MSSLFQEYIISTVLDNPTSIEYYRATNGVLLSLFINIVFPTLISALVYFTILPLLTAIIYGLFAKKK